MIDSIEEMNMNEVLDKKRIIFIAGEITQELANSIIARMLYYEAIDPNKDINIYLNTPGGDTAAMKAIIDMYEFVSCDICVVNLSCAFSAGSLLLACGTKGKRYMLPSAKVMIHQPTLISQKNSWTCNELEDISKQANKTKKEFKDKMMECSILTEEQLDLFLTKDTYLDANECIEYGIVDQILSVKEGGINEVGKSVF